MPVPITNPFLTPRSCFRFDEQGDTECTEEAGGDEGEEARRRQRSAVREELHPSILGDMLLTHSDVGPSAGVEQWLHSGHRRIRCWWVALPMPTQQQLGGCFGALGLHVASRVDASWRATQGPATGASTRAEPIPAGCEWVAARDTLVLPEFPPLPSTNSQFSLPPLPRLLPSWQQLQSLTRNGAALSQTLASPGSEAKAQEQISHSATTGSGLAPLGLGIFVGAGSAMALVAVFMINTRALRAGFAPRAV